MYEGNSDGVRSKTGLGAPDDRQAQNPNSSTFGLTIGKTRIPFTIDGGNFRDCKRRHRHHASRACEANLAPLNNMRMPDDQTVDSWQLWSRFRLPALKSGADRGSVWRQDTSCNASWWGMLILACVHVCAEPSKCCSSFVYCKVLPASRHPVVSAGRDHSRMFLIRALVARIHELGFHRLHGLCRFSAPWLWHDQSISTLVGRGPWGALGVLAARRLCLDRNSALPADP